MATLDQSNTSTPRPVAPSRSYTKPVVFLIVLAMLAGGAYFGYAAMTGGGDEEGAKALTHTVQRGDLMVTVNEDGSLESGNNVDVKCEVAGGSQIIFIVPDGKYVQEGDVIVELDKSTLEDQINQQQNVYEKARATVIQAEQDLQVATISIEEYELGTFKQQEQDADAQIKIALENLRNAENTLAHTQRMFRKGYVSKLELETQAFSVERAQLELDSAETAKEVLVNYTKKKTLEDLKAQKDIADAKLKSEEAAFVLEENKLTRLKEQLEKCSITAPTTGMVVYSNEKQGRWGGGGSSNTQIEEGAQVRERQSIVKIPDLTHMIVKVNVHESKVKYLNAGLPAVIQVQGKTLQGEVESIANQPESAGRFGANIKEYPTVVRINGRPEDLKPGLTAQVEILVANLKDVVRLPVSSVVEMRNGYACWVMENGKAERRDIEVGMTDGEYVEVKTGIEVDEVVYLNPRSVIDEAQVDEAVVEENAADKFGVSSEMEPTEGAGPPAGSEGRRGGGRGEGGARGEGGGRGDSGGDGGGRRGGGGGSFDLMQYDADKDGKVSKEEAPEQMQSFFDRLDTNGDGFIDSEEIEAMKARMGGGG